MSGSSPEVLPEDTCLVADCHRLSPVLRWLLWGCCAAQMSCAAQAHPDAMECKESVGALAALAAAKASKPGAAGSASGVGASMAAAQQAALQVSAMLSQECQLC